MQKLDHYDDENFQCSIEVGSWTMGALKQIFAQQMEQ